LDLIDFEMETTNDVVPTDPPRNKLFVAHLPLSLNDHEFVALFQQFGKISDYIILKDKRTLVSKGCGFVVFEEKEAADKAIETYDGKLKFPNHMKEMAVRYAVGKGDNDETKSTEHKIYVGNISRQTTEDDIRKLFESYGVITEIHMIKDVLGRPKGSAFVKYNTRAEAERAILNLHEKFTDRGMAIPLVLRLAHTTEEKKMLARPVIPPQTSFYNFNPYGPPMHQPNPYGAQHVQPNYYASAAHSAASAQTPQQQAYLQYAAQYQAAATQHNQYNPSAYAQPGYPASTYAPVAKDLRGPDGCNLFVYNLPDGFRDEDLHAMFTSSGNVISACVQRDLSTGVSRGFGFVSYDNPNSASAAIQGLDGFMIGPKKLMVRHKGPKRSNGGAKDPY